MLISEAFEHCIFKKQRDGITPKTVKNYRSTCNCFIRTCGDLPVELIDESVVMCWQLVMERDGKQSSTISGQISTVREVFKFLKKRNVQVIDSRDMELPRVIVNKKDYVTPLEARRMIDYAVSARDKALFAVLWSSGSRISEVLGLNRDALYDPKPRVIGKNSKEVVVRIDETARKHIEDYLNSRHDKLPALFISSQMRRMTVQRAEQIVNQIAGELGLQRPDDTDKNITPHSFRRGLATDLHEKGADIVDIQEVMGHTNLSTTRIYISPNERRREEVYSRYHTKI